MGDTLGEEVRVAVVEGEGEAPGVREEEPEAAWEAAALALWAEEVDLRGEEESDGGEEAVGEGGSVAAAEELPPAREAEAEGLAKAEASALGLRVGRGEPEALALTSALAEAVAVKELLLLATLLRLATLPVRVAFNAELGVPLPLPAGPEEAVAAPLAVPVAAAGDCVPCAGEFVAGPAERVAARGGLGVGESVTRVLGVE